MIKFRIQKSKEVIEIVGRGASALFLAEEWFLKSLEKEDEKKWEN